MAYAIVKCGQIRSSTAPVLTMTSFARNGSVVSIRLLPAATTVYAKVDIFVRTEGASDDVPVAYGLIVTPGVPAQLKGIFVHSLQTLVIQSSGDIDWIVEGFGQVNPTATDLPQGRLFSESGWKSPGNPYLRFMLPDYGLKLTDAVEADFFISGQVNLPTRVDVKVSNFPVSSDAEFNATTSWWLFTTVITPQNPTRILRKINFGYKYIIFKCYDENIAAFVQYNLKDHSLL